MTRFVVNARFLTQPITGVQRHAIEVSRRLRRVVPDIRFVTPAGVIHTDLARELDAQVLGSSSGHRWEQLELPRLLDGAGLISLCNASPVAVSRQIVTIHDAAPFSVPQAYSFAFRTWYRFMIRALGRRARAVMTDSHFSSGELQRCAGILADRLSVISLGSEHVQANGRDTGIIDRHDLRRRPYLLAVGSDSPHKNFAALMRAVQRLGDVSYLIVVAGGISTRVHASTASAHGGNDGPVRHVGRVTDDELRSLYEHAAGYVHPAYYEGFGLPPLEAMALGCAVLSARAGSLPEVLGDAADYFNPFDDTDIAAAIDRFMADERRRTELRRRGYLRAAGYSWDRTAEQVLALADRVLA